MKNENEKQFIATCKHDENIKILVTSCKVGENEKIIGKFKGTLVSDKYLQCSPIGSAVTAKSKDYNFELKDVEKQINDQLQKSLNFEGVVKSLSKTVLSGAEFVKGEKLVHISRILKVIYLSEHEKFKGLFEGLVVFTEDDDSRFEIKWFFKDEFKKETK